MVEKFANRDGSRPFIDTRLCDSIRAACRSRRFPEGAAATFHSCSLGAAMELACWAASAPDESSTPVAMLRTRLRSLNEALRIILENHAPELQQLHGAPTMELRRCPTATELRHQDNADWFYFLDRFRRSLTTRLFLPAKRASAISAGLAEMVDNVVQHAGLGEAPAGLVGYVVEEGRFEIAVADLGQGVRASLQQNPALRSLTSDHDALKAAVLDGASRRSDSPGTGFGQLIRAFADLRGELTFRSGSARLDLDGTGHGSRKVVQSRSEVMSGFQLSAIVRPGVLHSGASHHGSRGVSSTSK